MTDFEQGMFRADQPRSENVDSLVSQQIAEDYWSGAKIDELNYRYGEDRVEQVLAEMGIDSTVEHYKPLGDQDAPA